MSGYLVHHGILGQKWGKKNGPPYPIPAGEHSSAEKKANAGEKWLKQDVKQGKDKPAVSRSEVILKKSKDATDAASNIVNEVSNIKRSTAPKEDLSKYSDKELRDKVNRLNLEKQYRYLTEPELSKGEFYATKTLSIAGDVLAIGLSVAGIAATIYNIKRG